MYLANRRALTHSRSAPEADLLATRSTRYTAILTKYTLTPNALMRGATCPCLTTGIAGGIMLLTTRAVAYQAPNHTT